MDEYHSPVTKFIIEHNIQPKYIKLTDFISEDLASKKEEYFIKLFRILGENILNIAKAGGLGNNYLYWDYNKCEEEILKYSNLKDFRMKSTSAYTNILKKGWVELLQKLNYNKKPANYWNVKENCRLETLKYDNRTDFRKYSRGAYNSCRNNNWLKEFSIKFNNGNKPSNYWSFNICQDSASKCSNIVEFHKLYNGAYKESKKNGWVELFFNKKEL